MNATQQGSARPAPGPRGELSARYLVLFGDALAPRAALFGAGDRLLTELIEHDDYVQHGINRYNRGNYEYHVDRD